MAPDHGICCEHINVFNLQYSSVCKHESQGRPEGEGFYLSLIGLIIGRFLFFFSLVGFCFNLCSKHVPCKNGGSCLKQEDGENRCYCTPEWTGPYCNTPKGERGERCYKEGIK